ncbi:butyrophilin subfamily 1 member A1-like [Polypterus senegalus]
MKSHSQWHGCLSLFFIMGVSSNKDSLFSNSNDILVAAPGEMVTLPCLILSKISARDMEVRWYIKEFDNLVHLYHNQQDDVENQRPDYKGRTSLSKIGLEHGDLSLMLRGLRPADSGNYSCFASSESWYDEVKVALIVGATGTPPRTSLDSTNGGAAVLTCTSEKWYPKPEVKWRDQHGHDVGAKAAVEMLQDSQGFLSIRSSIVIQEESNTFSCLVRNNLPKTDTQSLLHVSQEVFPHVSGSLVAFIIILFLIVAVTIASILISKRMEGLKKKYEQKGDLLPYLYLYKEIEKICSLPKSEWQAMIDCGVEVILDPTVQFGLILSEDGKRARRADVEIPNPSNNPQKFDGWPCVLATEGYTWGKFYWEVEVEGNTYWRLGITKESAERQGGVTMQPQTGYWVLRYFGEEFSILTDPKTPLFLRSKPSKVGLFLNYEDGHLSFYNVDTRSHIYSFTRMEFNVPERLYPLFLTLDTEHDITVSPIRHHA